MNFGPSADETLSNAVNAVVDAALEAENALQKPRDYIGGSRLGLECIRALAYEWRNQQALKPAFFPGKALRHFRVGHNQEDETAAWLRKAGFDLRTADENGKQFGFATAWLGADKRPKIKGNLDGAVLGFDPTMARKAGVSEELIAVLLALPFPLLWEHKIMNVKNYVKLQKEGLKASKPVYYGQVQTYMGYMGLPNGCLFTAFNRDSSDLWMEFVRSSEREAAFYTDRGIQVLQADKPEQLPREGRSEEDFVCKWCAHKAECWSAPVVAPVAAPAWLQQKAS